MRRRTSSKPVDAVTVERHDAPDLARQARALLALLRSREAQRHVNEDTVEERETEFTHSNAPAGEPTGAQDHPSAVTSGAANKQGSPHDTIRRP